jgi:hypothetical protein
MVVPLPTEALLGEVGEFDSELSAYLWFDYVRSRPSMNPSQVLLVVKKEVCTPIEFRSYCPTML